MDTELPRVVSDRYEVQEADHPDVKDHLWFEVDDFGSQDDAMEALLAREEKRPGYCLRIVRFQHTEVFRRIPARSCYDEPETCPDDRDDLAPFSAAVNDA